MLSSHISSANSSHFRFNNNKQAPKVQQEVEKPRTLTDIYKSFQQKVNNF